MPVARETTSAISSAPTWVRSNLFFTTPSLSPLASAAAADFSFASSSGNLPYCNSATCSNLPSRCNLAMSARTFSISSLRWAAPSTAPFSAFQISSRSAYSAPKRLISSSIKPKRFCEASSFSFLTASRSIFSWIRRRSSLSITSGLESISIRIREPASSIKSIALSGKKRSVM